MKSSPIWQVNLGVGNIGSKHSGLHSVNFSDVVSGYINENGWVDMGSGWLS